MSSKTILMKQIQMTQKELGFVRKMASDNNTRQPKYHSLKSLSLAQCRHVINGYERAYAKKHFRDCKVIQICRHTLLMNLQLLQFKYEMLYGRYRK